MPETAASAVARLAPRTLSGLQRGNTLMGIGDSIMQSDGASGSWLSRLCMMSGQRIRFAGNAGVFGEELPSMLARLGTDVIAFRPAWCIEAGGANDIAHLGDADAFGVTITEATIRANKVAIWTRLIANGINPIAATITPAQWSHDSRYQAIERINAWIRWYGVTHGLPVVDLGDALKDRTTGIGSTAYYVVGDSIHPLSSGQLAMATRAYSDLSPLFPAGGAYLDQFSQLTNSAANMLQRSWFDVDSNADGVSDGWTKSGTWGSGVTPTLVSGDTTIYGNWQQWVVSSASLRYISAAAVNGSWSVGDRLAFAVRVSLIDSDLTKSLQATATVNFVGNGAALTPLYNLTGIECTNWVAYGEIVVPSGATTVSVLLSTPAGTGTVRWAQPTLVNMTRLGMV